MIARIELVEADITTLNVDAIVNAANKSLLGGGGVDGAIHRTAGPQLLAACRRLGGCATGQAKITPGFALPASWVIHTVGPVWRDGSQNEAALLASCYAESLKLAEQHHLAAIAFPCISTGVYAYPPALAAGVALQAVRTTLARCPHIKTVCFCCFSAANAAIYRALLAV